MFKKRKNGCGDDVCYRVTVTATVAVCFNAPLVPVIVTVYVPLLIDEGT